MARQFKFTLKPEFDEEGYCITCGHMGTLAPGVDLFCERCPPEPPGSWLAKYLDVEATKLSDLSDAFSKSMHEKMLRALREKGRGGWDDPAWTIDQIKASLIEHIEKGDPVDVAIYAAFWWNRLHS